MKLGIAIPAYRNPTAVNAVVYALQHLSSGQNDLTFAIGVDNDDTAMVDEVYRSHWPSNDVQFVVRDPVPGLGEKSNLLFQQMNADAYLWIADDVLPLRQNWDCAVPVALQRVEAFCWNELSQPGHPTYPVMSKRFMRALGMKPFPDYFPFWFIDTWLAEVYYMVFGEGIPVLDGLDLGGRRGASRGRRDVKFWYEFFVATRSERIDIAERVSRKYGAPFDYALFRPVFDEWDKNLSMIQNRKEPEPDGEPSERYLLAKQRAERWLEDNQRKVA